MLSFDLACALAIPEIPHGATEELTGRCVDAKANKEMAEKAKGKGPLNAGQQGIKKSGKK